MQLRIDYASDSADALSHLKGLSMPPTIRSCPVTTSPTSSTTTSPSQVRKKEKILQYSFTNVVYNI